MTLSLPADAADWSQAWRDRINDREAFESAAEDFAATFLFEIQADDRYDGDPIQFHVTIDDGVCTTTALVEESTGHDFALRGPYQAWTELLAGELSVSNAVMDGTFDVTGNTMTLLRRQAALDEMVSAARTIDTVFEH